MTSSVDLVGAMEVVDVDALPAVTAATDADAALARALQLEGRQTERERERRMG